ncbi:MAG: DUF268 domain-containing protein [Patescibacteria group bacterium]|nr:DUF268 domain-containing protein [Patescibacteria group bacterium]MDE1966824.1 DUF268 domain-containing protein [Patescibacteria group bacterium]
MRNLITDKINRTKKEKRLRRDFKDFVRLSRSESDRFSMSWNDRMPIYEDTEKTPFDTHYIYHPAWAARILAKINPKEHVDISSTLHFCSIVSAFVTTRFYDYRPADLKLSNLTSNEADLTKLPFIESSLSSLSCMHVIEHIGLGRYGDPLDPAGDIKAMRELERVLAPGGSLIFVVPVGKPKIVFNAHRIYSYEQIKSQFKNLKLQEFSLIPDNALDVGMIANASKEQSDAQSYGCGCFHFIKP